MSGLCVCVVCLTAHKPTTKQQYESSSVQLPPSLFAHNTQRSAAQSVHAASPGTAKGVLGRIRDALERQVFNLLDFTLACVFSFVCTCLHIRAPLHVTVVVAMVVVVVDVILGGVCLCCSRLHD